MWSRTFFDMVCKLCYNLHWCWKSKSYVYNNRDKSLCSSSYLINSNAKLLPQLKSGFKRTISWNKYLSKPELLPQNPNLNHLIEPSFQGVNRLFVLAFENDDQRVSNKGYFDQPINSNLKTYDNIRKTSTGKGDDYTTGCLLDYTYFKNYYKMIVVDLSKQQAPLMLILKQFNKLILQQT